MIHVLNWGFRSNNPIDWIDKDLFTPDGKIVKISLFGNFVITLDGNKALSTDDNTSVCYWLNGHQVGVKQS